jgi:hypothetical protein
MIRPEGFDGERLETCVATGQGEIHFHRFAGDPLIHPGHGRGGSAEAGNSPGAPVMT